MPRRLTVAAINQEIDRLARKRAQLEYLGQDEYEDGEVLAFDKTFGGTQIYSYAAIKAAGLWYLTGRTSHGISWEELCEFLSDGVEQVYWADHFTEIDR